MNTATPEKSSEIERPRIRFLGEVDAIVVPTRISVRPMTSVEQRAARPSNETRIRPCHPFDAVEHHRLSTSPSSTIPYRSSCPCVDSFHTTLFIHPTSSTRRTRVDTIIVLRMATKRITILTLTIPFSTIRRTTITRERTVANTIVPLSHTHPHTRPNMSKSRTLEKSSPLKTIAMRTMPSTIVVRPTTMIVIQPIDIISARGKPMFRTQPIPNTRNQVCFSRSLLHLLQQPCLPLADSYVENQRRRAVRDAQGYYFPYKRYTLHDYKGLQKLEAHSNPYAPLSERTRQSHGDKTASLTDRDNISKRDRVGTPLSHTNAPISPVSLSQALEYAKVQVKHPERKSTRSNATHQYVNSLFPPEYDDQEGSSTF